MSLAAPLASPFYTGVGSSTLVPSKWDVAFNDRVFMIDTKFSASENWMQQSIRLLKPQTDDSGVVSEASLNPEEFARRAQESWHGGAGQDFLDRPESSGSRFRSSKGWDIWTRYELTLLPATDEKKTTTATNLYLAVAGAYLGLIDGSTIVHTQDITVDSPTWTSVTNQGGSMTSITSDGSNFYATDGSDIYEWANSATDTGSAWSTFDSDLLGFVLGRLMSAHDSIVSNITGSAAKTDVVTPADTSFRWVGFAEGPGNIYMAGYAGDKSLIYRTAIKADGTNLDVGTVAGQLPDGEIVRAIKGYLGFLLIGTDKGVRLATIDADGNLTIGALIELDSPVRCFEGQGRFVWFGWQDYDSTSTGLGRLDLTQFNGSAPAYASDLMCAEQGAVLDVATFQDVRVFTVSGDGVFAQDSALVESATLESGLITYGLAERKVAFYLTVSHRPLAGSLSVALAGDSGAFTTLASFDEANSSTFTTQAGQTSAETFEVRLTGERDAVATTGPTVNRYTLEANPAPGRGQFVVYPLLLWDFVETPGGVEQVDTKAARAALDAMEASGLPITVQDVAGTFTAVLDDHVYLAHAINGARTDTNGTYIAKVRKPRKRSTI